jgi:hypothetical protein
MSCASAFAPRQEADDGFFAERLGGLQAVQALNEHETRSVGPYEDWCLQALVENARGDLIYSLPFKGGAPFHRHVRLAMPDGVDFAPPQKDRTNVVSYHPGRQLSTARMADRP